MSETQLQLQSTVNDDGTLRLELAEVPVPTPGTGEVLVRVEATPINPSDLGLLLGMADLGTAEVSGTPERPVVTAKVPENALRAAKPRLNQPMPVGNEGAGTVVAAGEDELAASLLGKTVAILGGAMYGQYRCIKAKQCLVLPEGTTAVQGASCFVNPLTALGMVETMRHEGHSALAHTAAASNLGQMLQKICLADGVGLVNIVRKPEQVEVLRGIGAEWVCNSSEPGFMDDLIAAFEATGATLAFDAIGGGTLASQILTAMEVAASRNASEFSRYGSTTHKQVYIYGGLDTGPTILNRGYGMAWGVGGWLLTPFLQKIGFEEAEKLRQRVAREITTTFASHYTREISLAEALDLDNMRAYEAKATGEKFLIRPNKDL